MRESPNNYNTSLTHKNIPSKIEHKRHSVKIELGIRVFVAVRLLDMFLQFMFGPFLSSGRTSNQVTEAGME